LFRNVGGAELTPLARFSFYSNGPFEPTLVGDRAYFFVRANDGIPGTYLWHTDGTETNTRRIGRRVSLETNDTGQKMSPIALGDQLIFRGQDNENGWEPWTSDGTESGTQIIKDINPGIADGIPYPGPGLFIQLGNELLFNALAPVHGEELWSTDGTPFYTRLVRDMTPADHTLPNKFGLVGDQVWFNTLDRGIALSDGTASGTVFLDHRDSMPVGTPIGLRGAPIARGDEVFMLTTQGLYKAAAVDNRPPVVNAITTYHTSVPLRTVVFFSEDIRDSLSFEEVVVKNVATGARVELTPQDIVWDPTLGKTVSISFNSYFPNLPDGNYRLSIPAGAVQDIWGNTSQADWSIDFFALEADFNHDRWIDDRDFSTLAANFNKNAGYASGDINRSGNVDIADFAIFAPRFNSYLAPPAAPRAAQPSSREPARAFSTVPVSTREIDLIQTDEEIFASSVSH
jgi:ELWxxDGT repeat protein